MASNFKKRLVARLPDIAILMMVGVISISLSLIGKIEVAAWIILPLLVYLGFSWYDEYRAASINPVSHDHAKKET
jgi:hypothetical protein